MKACDYCVFIFYFLLNGFTILSLFTFSKEFFNRFSWPFHASFFSSAIYSYYLLLTIRKDPGIVIANNYSNIAMTIVDDQNGGPPRRADRFRQRDRTHWQDRPARLPQSGEDRALRLGTCRMRLRLRHERHARRPAG